VIIWRRLKAGEPIASFVRLYASSSTLRTDDEAGGSPWPLNLGHAASRCCVISSPRILGSAKRAHSSTRSDDTAKITAAATGLLIRRPQVRTLLGPQTVSRFYWGNRGVSGRGWPRLSASRGHKWPQLGANLGPEVGVGQRGWPIAQAPFGRSLHERSAQS
jgi:hypothetical protein